MKKAIVIDSAKRDVYAVSLGNDYKEIYPYIGPECTTFCCPVELENGDAMFADDEGLFHTIHGGFMMPDWRYPIVGNVVLLNTDEDGESVSALSDIEDLKSKITWIDAHQANLWADYALGQPRKIYHI